MGTTVRAALVAATTAGLLVSAMPVQAQQSINWTGATSSGWFTADNWDGGVPTASDEAVLDIITPNPTLISGGAAVAGLCVVGRSGTGSLAITNGGTLSSDGIIGDEPSGQGTVTVSGAGSTWTSGGKFFLAIGLLGTGALSIEDGGTVSTGIFGVIGLAEGSVGQVTVTGDGSTWTLDEGFLGVGGNPFVEGGGTGTLTVADGGAVSAKFGVALAGSQAGSSSIGTVNIGAAPGDVPVASGTLTTPGLAFGQGTATLNFNHTESDYEFAPLLVSDVSAEGQVNVLAGTTRMTGDSPDFAGTTQIEGATLLVEGILGGTIEVQAGGRLAGTGTVGVITNAGTVAPGDSIGTLHVSVDYGHTAAGTFEVEIEPGGGADLLDVAGAANLAGGTVSVSLAPGDYATGSQFPILTAAQGISGTFDTLVQDNPDVPLELVQEDDTVFLVVLEEKVAFSPAALAIDSEPLISDGNGVFEPGERVEAAPAWRNDGGSPQLLAGLASGFTGPDGPAYTLVVDAADYGEVAPGEIASCQSTGLCYQMDIGPEGVPRPVPHWDAVFEEMLFDEMATTWTLHVGDSFTDVPRSDLFYPFIETLLHHGVTTGCGDGNFCPAAATNRAAMAVFVLKAQEGSDYTPPDCTEGEEVFDDVPADDPFCPWIEELADRGVVAGCGGGNYCPAASVTREQVTVFVLRALEGPKFLPPDCTEGEEVFGDVPHTSLFCPWIEEFFSRGFTSGCGGGNYCPSPPAVRGVMSVFLSRGFDLALYGP